MGVFTKESEDKKIIIKNKGEINQEKKIQTKTKEEKSVF